MDSIDKFNRLMKSCPDALRAVPHKNPNMLGEMMQAYSPNSIRSMCRQRYYAASLSLFEKGVLGRRRLQVLARRVGTRARELVMADVRSEAPRDDSVETLLTCPIRGRLLKINIHFVLPVRPLVDQK